MPEEFVALTKTSAILQTGAVPENCRVSASKDSHLGSRIPKILVAV